MTVLEPLPGTYGKADWENYKNYWREEDAEWMQDRMVLRVLTSGDRDALLQSPGSLVYNEALDQVELRSKLGGYKTLTPLPTSLATSEAGGKTTIGHTGAGGLGLTFTAAEVGVNTNFNVLNGVLTVNSTGVSIKTGAKTAKLTTDATYLVSDSPVSMPGLALTGGTLNATGRGATLGSLTVEGAATVNGALNAASGTIGGVGHSGGRVTAGALGQGGLGVVTDHGIFYGDASSAVMRYWSGSAMGGPYLQVTNSGQVASGGGNFDVYNQMRIMQLPIQYYYGGVGIWNFAPSFYSAGDPGAQYFPDGTIWVQ